MRVLLVEDHRPLAELLVKGLAQFGFGVDSFPTAAAALNAAKVLVYGKRRSQATFLRAGAAA